MPTRKRTRAEMEAVEPPPEKQEPSLLHKVRNMWEFASVMQFIYLFGKIIKIDDDFDVEDFEEECLKPGSSEKLEEIGLTLLKWISSHRGLTYDIWDEYVRRQYLAKAPERNPYGDEEEPKKFRTFDIFQRIRILHQLTVWTLWNPDRIRERMVEHQKDSEQTEWRMEPFGWDVDEREYYILDDNRMYRRTEPALPAVTKARPKANTNKARAARRRASKRRKIEYEDADSEAPDDEDNSILDTTQTDAQESHDIDTYGGWKWECIAITLSDYNEFLESIKKTKDENEKELRGRILEDVLPVIEAAAEKQRRKQERREKELLVMERMAGAKRSSRLADKQEREKKELEEAETAKRKAADLAAAHREQERQQIMEEERRSRMMTREQRIKDREYKRLLMEEELARDAEEQKRIEEGEKRGSGRHLKERIEKNKKELEDLDMDENWTFDCSGCGKHGKNYDDGSHSVACERCNVWQHSKCLGISKAAAEKDDFHLVCGDCRRKEEDAKRPKIMLKFGSSANSSSPPQPLPQSPIKHQQPSRMISVDVPMVSASLSGMITNGSLLKGATPILGPVSKAPMPSIDSTFGPSLPSTQKLPHHGPSSPRQPGALVFAVNPQHHFQHTRNGTHDQKQESTGQSMVAAKATPRPSSSHAVANGPSTMPKRLPSPVLNRPTMSPTQGNPEVGPIAGVPGSSPSVYKATLFTPNTNGVLPRPSSQGEPNSRDQPHRLSLSPRQSFMSHTPNAQHTSGLSPVKQRVNSPSPLPPSQNESWSANSMSPPMSSGNSASFSNNVQPALRSVSGTPIFPPAKKLAPSPEQINREPMPTPSKQPSPPMPAAEFRRVSGAMTFPPQAHLNGDAPELRQQATPHSTLPASRTSHMLNGASDAGQS